MNRQISAKNIPAVPLVGVCSLTHIHEFAERSPRDDVFTDRPMAGNQVNKPVTFLKDLIFPIPSFSI